MLRHSSTGDYLSTNRFLGNTNLPSKVRHFIDKWCFPRGPEGGTVALLLREYLEPTGPHSALPFLSCMTLGKLLSQCHCFLIWKLRLIRGLTPWGLTWIKWDNSGCLNCLSYSEFTPLTLVGKDLMLSVLSALIVFYQA